MELVPYYYEPINIPMGHEGVSSIIQNLNNLVGGIDYIVNNNVSFLDSTILKADLAWGDDEEEHTEDKFRRFCNSILSDLSELTNYCVTYKMKSNEVTHWDCITQTLPDFIDEQMSGYTYKKSKCKCFEVKARCKCFQIRYVERQSFIDKHYVGMMLCHHIFNRRWLNILGLPMPGRERVYTLKTQQTNM
ncbi:hypothetical protein [Shewanella aestuarii]|uniref:Uncharacterized protein n=1 Tax=Shewanella aestuarii TaxID=1028752 RepID=A0A6G9QPE3_9GAMM|nr:hypothetical protein [Shewanella aestuarii]QIR16436.1 hypothetical protein HBH39_18360 [Shewanella aestuarii]